MSFPPILGLPPHDQSQFYLINSPNGKDVGAIDLDSIIFIIKYTDCVAFNLRNQHEEIRFDRIKGGDDIFNALLAYRRQRGQLYDQVGAK